MAYSVSGTTPYGRRPESRASVAATQGPSRAEWHPTVGQPVRISGSGMEGTLRYLGKIEGKDGIWAGVELDEGFAGKGRNDGTVDGYVCSKFQPSEPWRQRLTGS